MNQTTQAEQEHVALADSRANRPKITRKSIIVALVVVIWAVILVLAIHLLVIRPYQKSEEKEQMEASQFSGVEIARPEPSSFDKIQEQDFNVEQKLKEIYALAFENSQKAQELLDEVTSFLSSKVQESPHVSEKFLEENFNSI